MRTRATALLLVGVATVALVQGYTLAPGTAHWSAGPVTFRSYLDSADAQRAVALALRRWQEPLLGEVQLDAVAGRGDVVIGNQMNEVGWEALPPEVVSLTRIVSRGDRVLEADISVSADAADGGHWSLDGVLLHEVGHALGLGHADAGEQMVDAAMSADPGATSATLTRDDEAGLIEVYRRDDPLARVRAGLAAQVVAFPPRNEPFAFRQQLETVYQVELGRSATLSFVDLEGSVIWTQEYIRYRVNGCDHATATSRVFAQIEGRGIQPICSEFSGTAVLFPPRNEPFLFRLQLETEYRDFLRRGSTPTFVDPEGDVIWTQEYLRYRVNGCSHTQAVDRVLVQVRGGGVQPVCATLPPTPPPTTPQTATLRGTVSENFSARPLPAVRVTVATFGFGGGTSQSATTGSDGRYVFTGLTPGRVTISATLQGYLVATQEATLAAGEQTVNFTLTRAPSTSLSNYEVVQSTNATTGAAGTTGEVTVACPVGKRVLGGGYTSTSGIEVWRVFRNHPTNDGSGWVVTFTSVTAGQPVRAVAVCASVPAELGYEVVNGTNVTLGATGSLGDVVATCPGNKQVLGGGYLSIAGVERWRVFRHYPLTAGTGWTASFTVTGGTGEGVRAVAVCASVPAELGYEVVASAAATTAAVGGFGAVSISCPANKRVLGGGYVSDDGLEVWRVFRNHPGVGEQVNGLGWSATYTSVTAGRPIRARAVCGTVPEFQPVAR